MFARHLLTATVLGLAAAWTAPATAQEGDVSPPAAESPAEDVAELIRQLDADRFTDRQAASNKLEAAGERAIPHLIETAENGSVEASARAVNILAAHLSGRDAATKAAAREALEKLAESKNASTARRAKGAIEESQKPQPATAPARRAIRIIGANGRIQIGGAVPGGQIQVQVQQRAVGGGRQVTITTVNGVKTINAVEGNRKVQIKDDPQNGIEMEVTETKDGKAVTEKYKAKNAEDLKKKHPDAYKIYDEYARQGGVQVQQAADVQRRVFDTQMNTLERLSDSLQRSLERLEIEGGDEAKKEIKQHLENVKKELEQARRKLADDGDEENEEKADE
jgi:hypothetical protein